MQRPALALWCVLWSAGLPLAGEARLYRWVDETGATVYSQVPPPGNTPAAAIPAPALPPPAVPATEVQRQAREAAEREFDQREEAARAAATASKQAVSQAARRDSCAAARKNLDTLTRHAGSLIHTPDGAVHVYSTAELADLRAQAQRQIGEFCD